MIRFVAVLAMSMIATGVRAAELPGRVHADFPMRIHKEARYLVYSHGRIVEGDDERPVSPDHGIYDFPGIRAALARSGDFEVIAPHRASGLAAEASAQQIHDGVRRLVAAGVKPSRITLIGFSRGGFITALASSRLADLGLNTAIMAICVKGFPSAQAMTLAGNVLSIYETSDDVGSCAGLRDSSPAARFEEVALSTGLRHGTFYRPIEAWLQPLRAWIDRTNR
jgi:pimeloyl-ACP methyl ester carboxylesterase